MTANEEEMRFWVHHKDFFQKKYEQGYRELQYGEGDIDNWLDDIRMASIFIFYHPNGKISTLYSEIEWIGNVTESSDGISSERRSGLEDNEFNVFSKFRLKRFLDKYGIELITDKEDLRKFIDNWEDTSEIKL